MSARTPEELENYVRGLELRSQALEGTIRDLGELVGVANEEIRTRDATIEDLRDALAELLEVASHAGTQAPPAFIRARELVEGDA